MWKELKLFLIGISNSFNPNDNGNKRTRFKNY